MPIAVGSNAASKVYLGATEVTKVYLGATELYSSGPATVVGRAVPQTLSSDLGFRQHVRYEFSDDGLELPQSWFSNATSSGRHIKRLEINTVIDDTDDIRLDWNSANTVTGRLYRVVAGKQIRIALLPTCLLYTSPSPRD